MNISESNTTELITDNDHLPIKSGDKCFGIGTIKNIILILFIISLAFGSILLPLLLFSDPIISLISNFIPLSIVTVSIIILLIIISMCYIVLTLLALGLLLFLCNCYDNYNDISMVDEYAILKKSIVIKSVSLWIVMMIGFQIIIWVYLCGMIIEYFAPYY